jgi:hypothetical protein
MGELATSDKQHVSVRDKVFAAEFEMLKRPQVPLRVKHYFAAGVYARELFIPAGVLLTGKIHKYPQINIMSAGDLSVLLDDGTIRRVRAPFTVVSPAGTKRIAYAHEDTVWTTLHATEDTDLDRIEEHFIAQTEREYLAFTKRLTLTAA